MRDRWTALRDATRGVPLPAAFIDLDALDRNVAATGARLMRGDTTLRVASKSVRSVAILRHILARGGPRYRGIMCFAAPEADFLVEQGFDDVFVAYPTVQEVALSALARRVAGGATVWFVADCPEHIEALGRAGRAFGVELRAVVELDTSYRPLSGRVHLGARRSPIRTPEAAVALARRASETPGVRLRGLMGYEAHIAGVQDASPFDRAMNAPKRALKRRAGPVVAALRAATVDALRRDGHELDLVNGGGTGSVHLTSAEPSVTEVTAGSGYLCPHLFDYFADFCLEPAAFYGVEVVRASDPQFVTVAGGGFVASGAVGRDKQPLPWLPPGLKPLDVEGIGEVQTPLRRPEGRHDLRIGDPVFFRHAKAGELAERFTHYHLVRGDAIVDRVTTYRGDGQCFG